MTSNQPPAISLELLRRFDVTGPRYTSYPTADRFVEAFDAADLPQAGYEAHPGRSTQAFVIIRPPALLRNDLLLLRMQQDRHQGSWAFGRVHPILC